MSEFDDLTSPSQIFKPRNPGVRRTPPASASPAPQAPLTNPTPTQLQTVSASLTEGEDSMDMDVEESVPGPSQTPRLAKSGDVPPEPAEDEDEDADMAAYSTPGPSRQSRPRTPRSIRKSPAEVAKILNTPVSRVDEGDYADEDDDEGRGKRWKATMDTLDLAIKAAAQKWTAKDFKQCFPSLAEKEGREMEEIWLASTQTMKTHLMDHAMQIMRFFKIPAALERIDEVVAEAQEYARTHRDVATRHDAWRADTTPEILTAATDLPMYDEAYGRLRDEYLGLYSDCKDRYESISTKQAMLAETEDGVADGVVELEKAVELLQGFPTEEMMTWVEDVSSTIPGIREQ